MRAVEKMFDLSYDITIINNSQGYPMSNFIINGGRKLHGMIKTNSAKNSAVAILCSLPMIRGKTILSAVPRIEEVYRIIEILTSIGLKITWLTNGKLEIINSGRISLKAINRESYKKTRSAILLIGALTSVFKNFSLPKIGGCELGGRTINPHLIALGHLGIEVKKINHQFYINQGKAHGASFTMYESGDTATENAILAAVLLPGITEINLCSSNYMVQDLCHFLVQAGAKIKGIGATKLKITGVKKLKPVNYSIMPDPIESMAFISIAITTGFVAHYSAESVAGFGLASRIESIFLVLIMGLSSIMGPFVGQNWGAHRQDRVAEALRKSFRFCLIWGGSLTLLLWLCADPIVSLFSTDPAVIASAQSYLHLVPISYFFLGVIMIASSAANGMGDPKPSLIMSFLRLLVLYIPLALLLPIWIGIEGVYLAAALANIVVGIGALMWSQRFMRPS